MGKMMRVKTSAGGVTHGQERAGLTVCGRDASNGHMWNAATEVTCRQCLRAIYALKMHVKCLRAIYALKMHVTGSECHELCDVHPKAAEAVGGETLSYDCDCAACATVQE